MAIVGIFRVDYCNEEPTCTVFENQQKKTRMRAKRASEFRKIPQRSAIFRKTPQSFAECRKMPRNTVVNSAEFYGILRNFAELEYSLRSHPR